MGQMFFPLMVLVCPVRPLSGAEFERVSVGEHALQLSIRGKGLPTVVFESGQGSGLEVWDKVQLEVARFTRTVAYDRAGLGKSEEGPQPRDARQIARELHTALHKSGAEAPYVLVGHSVGAFYIRVFADLYPEEIAGLVFVDPTTEQFIDWLKANRPDAATSEGDVSRMSPGRSAEWDAKDTNLEQARSARLRPGIPIMVLTAVRPEQTRPAEFLKIWSKTQEEWLKKLPNAKQIVTEKSGHNIQKEQPDLVIEAVQKIIEQAGYRNPAP